MDWKVAEDTSECFYSKLNSSRNHYFAFDQVLMPPMLIVYFCEELRCDTEQ